MTDAHIEAASNKVPVVRRVRPGDSQVALVFASGLGSVSIPTAGLPHLVEHAVMRGIGDLPHEHNASTDRDSVIFFASGSPAELSSFTEKVTASIRRVAHGDVSELHRDVAAIDAELTNGVFPAAGPLARRFGYRGPALAEFGAPTLDRATVDDVAGWAREHLHRANAALVMLTDDERLSIDVELTAPAPDWQRAPATPPHPLDGRFWAWSEAAPVGLSFDVTGDWPIAHFVGMLLEARFMGELRHDRGLIYSVVTEYLSHTREHRTLSMYLDPQPAQSVEVVRALLSILDSTLAGDGDGDDDVLETTRSRFVSDLGSSTGHDGSAVADGLAAATRRERTSTAAALESIRHVSTADVVRSLRPVAEGLMVTLNAASGGIDATVESTMGLASPQVASAVWPERTPFEWAARTSTRRTLTGAGRRGSPVAGSTLALDGTTLLVSNSDSAWAVDAHDAVLVLRAPAGIEITLEDSWSLEIVHASWKGSEAITSRFLTFVQPERIVNVEKRLGLRLPQ